MAVATCVVACLVWSVASPIRAADPVDFTRDVRPILAAHCFECHAAAKQESGLRLDSGATILNGGNSGPAIVAGKASESLLVRAVRGGSDEISKMPPEGKPLEPAEIELLARWIDQGASLPVEAPRWSRHAARIIGRFSPLPIRLRRR